MYIPPDVIIDIPNIRWINTTNNVNNFLCGRSKCGHSSTMPVTNDSTVQNCESIPSTNSIPKNSIAHKFGNGRRVTASGYTINAKPGPDLATSATLVFIVYAIWPNTENMTKPENNDVNELNRQAIRESLKKRLKSLIIYINQSIIKLLILTDRNYD